MIKHTLRIVVAILNLSLALCAAEKKVDFGGTWILDPSQTRTDETSPTLRQLDYDYGGRRPDAPSENVPGGRPPDIPPKILADPITLQVIQTDDEIQVTRQIISGSRQRTIQQKFTMNGSLCLNLSSDGQGEFASRSDWKNGKAIHSGTLTITTDMGRAETYTKEEYSLSNNGKKLIIKTMSTGPQGVTTLKQVFLRESDPKAE